jgi:hypothetical protein
MVNPAPLFHCRSIRRRFSGRRTSTDRSQGELCMIVLCAALLMSAVQDGDAFESRRPEGDRGS